MSVTEEIKSRLDIVNFISQYVQLKKAGRNYTACCPFHNEKTPSFVVFPESQNWRCFGACGEGGDIFNFMMKREGLDFTATLQLLAEKAGVELQQRTSEQVSQDEYLDKLRGLLQETIRFFQIKLQESDPNIESGALAYAHGRGLTDETLVNFNVGYAPDDWQQLIEHLTKLGYSQDDIIETGVAIRNDRGRVYDRFRNRLVIPIHDARGQVIGFGARALNPDDNPKYLNSPQTVLFDKSATLFGLHNARRAIRESETAVIVEGYMDAIQAHQAGFTNVVAQMGTALTEPQLRQLSKYARRLILALDPDAAGIKATMRGLDVARQTLGDSSSVVFDPKGIMRQASKLDVEIMVMTLPEGQDPDDLIRDDPDAWRQLVDTAQSVADYVIAAGTSHLTQQSTFSEREQVARQLVPILIATENDIQQHYNIQRLALSLRLDEGTLIDWVQQQARASRSSVRIQSPKLRSNLGSAALADSKPNSVGRTSEGYCLAMLIREPKLLATANRKLRELATKAPRAREALGPLSIEDWIRSDYRAIFAAFQEALAQDDLEPLEYLDQHLPYELAAELNQLLVDLMEIFRRSLHSALHVQLEFEAAATRRKREQTSASNEGLEFIQMILDLRKRRLKRENHELSLLQQTDQGSEEHYIHQSTMNNLAFRFIDEDLRQMAQLQRAH